MMNRTRISWLNELEAMLWIGVAVATVAGCYPVVRAWFGDIRFDAHADAAKLVDRSAPPPGIELGSALEATVTLPDAGLAEQLLFGLPTLAVVGLVVAGLLLALRIARSARLGEPFTRGTVRRLRQLGLLIAVGAPLAQLVYGVARAELIDRAASSGVLITEATFSFLPLLFGLAVLGLAEIFRHGVALRDDVEGLV